MRGKILFVVGLGLGYVLGTRAGREKYEQMKTAAQRVWNDPRVQARVDDVQDFVKDKAPEVAEFVTDNAKKVVASVQGKSSTATPKKSTTAASKSSSSRSGSSGSSRSTSSSS
ncbi:MAG: YtxH domain-containing protein [Actinomycetales bacterium]|nr:YtxH domain-containing protein [Actinomycetales bacterium]